MSALDVVRAHPDLTSALIFALVTLGIFARVATNKEDDQ